VPGLLAAPEPSKNIYPSLRDATYQRKNCSISASRNRPFVLKNIAVWIFATTALEKRTTQQYHAEER
jgi:hypothetical protein